MTTATDWLGQEYGPGDKVLYSKAYGAAGSQMILAEVVSVNPTTVTAKVLQGSRSGKSSEYTHVDSRTGRRIGYSDLHVKKKAHYRHKTTGEEITTHQLYERNPAYVRGHVVSFYLRNSEDYEYVSDEYWNYVVKGPYVQTLYIKDNVTKLPEGHKWNCANPGTAPVDASTPQATTSDAGRDSTATTTTWDVTCNARPVT